MMLCHFCGSDAPYRIPKIDRWYRGLPVWHYIWICNECKKKSIPSAHSR